MNVSNLSIGTLKFIAKQDNSRDYNKIMKEEMNRFINDSTEIGGSHNDIARALYSKYGSEIICGSITNKVWYYYNKNRWTRTEEGTHLRSKISTEVVKILNHNIKQIRREMKNLDNRDDSDDSEDEDTEVDVKANRRRHIENIKEKQQLEKKIDKLYKLQGNCKTAPYKNNIMREAMEIFYNPEFLTSLDNNPNIIAFKNGVYDFKSNMFRSGLPEDYVSIQMGVKYKNSL